MANQTTKGDPAAVLIERTMKDTSTPTEDDAGERNSIVRQLRLLLASARAQPRPFFGAYLGFHDHFGDRLVVDIDPRDVTHQFPPNREIEGEKIAVADYFLGRGNWRPYLEPLDRSVIHREVEDVIACGGDYRTTSAYAALSKRNAAGSPAVRNLTPLDSERRIVGYLEDLDKLIASIRDTGYRRRPPYRGLESAEEAASATSAVRPVVVELMESEVGMAVDANGGLIRVGPGNHRMAIARQLGLARIPVELRLFHVAWVRRAMSGGFGPLQAIVAGARRIGLKSQSNTQGATP